MRRQYASRPSKSDKRRDHGDRTHMAPWSWRRVRHRVAASSSALPSWCRRRRPSVEWRRGTTAGHRRRRSASCSTTRSRRCGWFHARRATLHPTQTTQLQLFLPLTVWRHFTKQNAVVQMRLDLWHALATRPLDSVYCLLMHRPISKRSASTKLFDYKSTHYISSSQSCIWYNTECQWWQQWHAVQKIALPMRMVQITIHCCCIIIIIIIINRQFLTRRNMEPHHPLQGRDCQCAAKYSVALTCQLSITVKQMSLESVFERSQRLYVYFKIRTKKRVLYLLIFVFAYMFTVTAPFQCVIQCSHLEMDEWDEIARIGCIVLQFAKWPYKRQKLFSYFKPRVENQWFLKLKNFLFFFVLMFLRFYGF